MKKFLSLLLAMAMTLSPAACGGSPAQDPPSDEEPAEDTPQTEAPSGIDASALYAIGRRRHRRHLQRNGQPLCSVL